jgi:hypothetical protein
MSVGRVIGALMVLAIGAFNAGHAADVRVEVTRVVDVREPANPYANLEVDLKLTGADVRGAKKFRCKAIKAADDTGRNLAPEKKNRPTSPISMRSVPGGVTLRVLPSG